VAADLSTEVSYVAQHEALAAVLVPEVARRLGLETVEVDLVYCSRSGPPQARWLEPDVNDHLEALAAETGCTWVAADLQEPGDVERLAGEVLTGGAVDAVVNNAGGALGVDPVAEGSAQEWATMYERNALAALRVSQAFLPGLRERGGDLVFLTSTAAHDTYPGGGGYVAAKHAERIIANTLRLELVGEPVRVIEIAPGMVATEEFSLNRLHGDAEAAAKVYAGVAEPLSACTRLPSRPSASLARTSSSCPSATRPR